MTQSWCIVWCMWSYIFYPNGPPYELLPHQTADIHFTLMIFAKSSIDDGIKKPWKDSYSPKVHSCTPPKSNIDTKNDGLENVSRFKHGYFGYLWGGGYQHVPFSCSFFFCVRVYTDTFPPPCEWINSEVQNDCRLPKKARMKSKVVQSRNFNVKFKSGESQVKNGENMRILGVQRQIPVLRVMDKKHENKHLQQVD